MALIRTIKPGFFISEHIVGCLPKALLIIGKWHFSDDNGIRREVVRLMTVWHHLRYLVIERGLFAVKRWGAKR